MILYLIPLVAGFILGYLYTKSSTSTFDSMIKSYLLAGKRVMICVDNDTTLMEYDGSKIKITRGTIDLNVIPVDSDESN